MRTTDVGRLRVVTRVVVILDRLSPLTRAPGCHIRQLPRAHARARPSGHIPTPNPGREAEWGTVRDIYKYVARNEAAKLLSQDMQYTLALGHALPKLETSLATSRPWRLSRLATPGRAQGAAVWATSRPTHDSIVPDAASHRPTPARSAP